MIQLNCPILSLLFRHNGHYDKYNNPLNSGQCKAILLYTQFHKNLLPLHHKESQIITLHLSRCTCRLL